MARRKRLDTTPEWKALKAHAAHMKGVSMRDLFAADPARGSTFTLEAGVTTATPKQYEDFL